MEQVISNPADLKEARAMGRVMANVQLTNEGDRIMAEQGVIEAGKVRRTQVEFLVDTGATLLCLPLEEIHRLGLNKVEERPVMTANGQVTRATYGPVRFEVMGRSEVISVMGLPAGTPPLLGYIPLELVDLVVNPKEQRLEGNPRNNGKWVLDLL